MPAYADVLDLLNEAIGLIDKIGDSVVAAHLSTAIDLVEHRLAMADPVPQ